MTQDAKNDDVAFDIDQVERLGEIMERFDLREVRLSRGDQKWILRRGAQETFVSAPVATAAAPVPVAAAPVAAAAPAPAAGGGADASAGLVAIESPAVGTFYVAPAPGEKAFVNVGDRVSHDTTVCIVEAMKTMNPIAAGVSGTISKIVLKDGDSVEFGQALFMVKPD